MAILPPLLAHGPRRWPALARHLPGLLALLMLAACAFAAGPAPPEALTVQQSEDKLALHADATDGCAFAGTWAYEAELPDGHVEGLIVLRNRGGELEGMHRFSARETFISPAAVTCPYETCELCPDAKVCATRFFITAGIEDSGRSAAGGAVSPAVGTRWTRLLLSADGQSLEISFWTPLRFLTTKARKVQGAACGADFDYVRDVARWANRGYPVPVLGVE
ncbi:MAG: hypothetical protein R3285_09560 [Kiloniellales bacterium]|nr:hypothetical protein [Kiloniellales bacterium]